MSISGLVSSSEGRYNSDYMVKRPPTFHRYAESGQIERLPVRLSPWVLLRREHFGGIVFDTRTGLTLDVDRAAFTWLDAARAHGVRPSGADDAENRLFARLLNLKLLTVAPGELEASATAQSASWPPGPHLTAPETVHWAITYACAAQCPDCYARRYRDTAGAALDTPDALRLVDRLAGWGVLQLAIGGGEPLLRADLAEIAVHAHERGLVVHVTSGEHQIPAHVLANLARGVTALQIGIKLERLLEEPDAEITRLAATVARAQDAGLHVGANLMLSRTGMAHVPALLIALRRAGFLQVTLLRYKPPADVARWQQESPSPQEIQEFARRLPAMLAAVPEMIVRLDCALSFLQRQMAPDEALAAGIRGCVAADRILALAPDGSMYPCSQLIHPHLRAGNVLADDPATVWATAPVLIRYRRFRTDRAYRDSWCGVCRAQAHCGGCRVFARDGFGADPECSAHQVQATEYPHWLANTSSIEGDQ